MWHKARAQLSQGVADRPHYIRRQPCVGAFPITILSTCPVEAVLKVSNAKGGAGRKLGLPAKLHFQPA
jgi:hypothetical protein